MRCWTSSAAAGPAPRVALAQAVPAGSGSTLVGSEPAPAAPATAHSRHHARLQRRRRALQGGFFALFLVAPALDWLRFDLHRAQLWFLGQPWTLGIDAAQRGQASGTEVALNILLRGILPALLFALAFLAVAWKYGRLYCGWLCPHFSMVELLNGLMHRATGRFSLWEAPAPGARPDRRWWPLLALVCMAAGFLWATTALTYLLPPREIWHGLLHASLTPNQARFIGIGTMVFSAEFLLARHLFCRFGCAVGFFQSVAWMANPKAMVIGFDRQRASACKGCATPASPQGDACETACPMRLQPRRMKRAMFTCVQCGQCLQACSHTHAARGAAAPSLAWSVGVDALRETLRQRQ